MLRKIKQKMRYISNRVIVLGLLVVLFMIGIFIAVFHYNFVINLAVLVMDMIILILIFYFWIFRPYRRCEEQIYRFVDGYMQLSEISGDEPMLSPGFNEVTKAVGNMMNSEQMMNLNKRQAQYLALQNQINPHFLYNTLDGIRSEALISGLSNVADMTEALATFFRYTISKVENLVTVEEELDNCRTYFKIQQYRFGERIQLEIVIDEDDSEEINHYLIPKLTLQPILENSIIHGTELKIGTGLTRIHIERTLLRLVIRVKDNGVGMSENTLEELNQKLNAAKFNLSNTNQESIGGIALANVSNRIHLIFGEEYGMHVFSMENVGTEVEITIPLVTNDSTLMNQEANSKRE